ncbi:MAG: M23 family metallopeptidase [Endozoicomonas sp. (ex Botrylloides leachii)]|nr:M23 family metallopeptidase [Endozoicomonas sp. (ex Botrylloides leachii)]
MDIIIRRVVINRLSVILLLMALLAISLSGRAALKTHLTQGGLFFGEVTPGSQVFYNGESISVSPKGQFILGFGYNAKLKQTYQVVDDKGTKKNITLKLTPREYAVQRINGVAKKYVKPTKMALERIKLDSQRVKNARLQNSRQQDFFQGFNWPLTGPITGVYGSQRVFNGEPRRPHFGVDIAAITGTKVHSPADGRVTLASNNLYFSGGTLIIDHGYGISSSFLHLSRVLVVSGQKVNRGDVIAEVGATGRVTGPHLDWRINWFEKHLDPQILAGAQK